MVGILQPDQKLSHYRLVEKIGAGGMGVVWKAEDTKLNRSVAIKFVTGGGVDSDERRTRFLREARLAASLNHPSICAIHQVAEVEAGELAGLPTGGHLPEGTPYLVQELVEGRPLDQVLASATPLPLDDVLRIATQVADGLAAAHAEGIVHRDLKPGNVMVTPDDRVRILDFGLAKHLWTADPEDGVLTTAETISAELTRAGLVLGTVAYMSPEQARGEELDHRSDVFSFGIMLYEMVCGQRPFRGETSETTRLKIIEAEPEPLPATGRIVPAELERIIWRCLRKKPGDRFNNTRDLVLTLEDLRHETASGRGLRASGAPDHGRQRGAGVLAWIVAAVATAVAVVGWLVRPAPELTVSPVTRFTVQLPEGERLAAQWRPAFTLSPDGRALAFVSGPVKQHSLAPESSRLYLLRFDQQDPRAIPGSEGARWPVFSPDGRSIVFSTADRTLKRIDIDGGEPMTLCECGWLFGLAWGADGRIIYATLEGGLYHLPATGGEPQPLTHLDPDSFEHSHRLPHLLPDGKAVLYTVTRTQTTGDMQTYAVVVESLVSGERRILLEGATDARYSPTGHLIFAREGRLMAASFDLDQLQITGPEVPLLEGVAHALGAGYIWYSTGAALLALSASGTLAYVPGSVDPPQLREPVWVDRQGHQTPLGVRPKEYWMGRVSRDGTQVLLMALDVPTHSDIWLFDVERGTMRRQTFEGMNSWGIWGPDEGSLTFESSRDGPPGLYTKPVDSGPGGAQRLGDGEYPSSWSPDGTSLAFVEWDRLGETGLNIWVLERGGEARPVLRNPYFDGYPEFSPDGRWLLYCNDESQRTEVYIRPFPGPGRAVQISTSGGRSPGWSRDGSEIFYVGDDDFYYAVPLHREGPQLSPGAPTRLFESLGGTEPVRDWDVAPDGRFLMRRRHESSISRRRDIFAPECIHVVLNWHQEVERIMSAVEHE